jgi:triacylglycerol esterase/lipase EstA (alpha/beta hydrolase family)
VLAPPSPWMLTRELLLGRDVARLALHAPGLRSLPRGDGDPVVLVPGFAATDGSLLPLRLFLRRLGHDARAVAFGRITGDVEGQAHRLRALVAAVHAETGREVTLVGWSIGGVISREVAREDPGPVRRVVTLGSPVVGGPSFTVLARQYDEQALVQIREAVERRNQVPIRVPVTAFWSRNDGIVLPEACVDEVSPDVENVEVTSTHLGMGVDPTVWRLVAERLACSTHAAEDEARRPAR